MAGFRLGECSLSQACAFGCRHEQLLSDTGHTQQYRIWLWGAKVGLEPILYIPQHRCPAHPSARADAKGPDMAANR